MYFNNVGNRSAKTDPKHPREEHAPAKKSRKFSDEDKPSVDAEKRAILAKFSDKYSDKTSSDRGSGRVKSSEEKLSAEREVLSRGGSEGGHSSASGDKVDEKASSRSGGEQRRKPSRFDQRYISRCPAYKFGV